MSIIGLRFLTIIFQLTKLWEALPVFEQTKLQNQPFLSQSLGDLLINAFILLIITTFFYRNFRSSPYSDLKPVPKYLMTFIYYFSISIGVMMVIGIIQSLVLGTGLIFDFDNIFNLNLFSLIAITGICIILFAFFLYSHRLMLSILGSGLDAVKRLLPLFGALAASVPIYYLFHLQISIPIVLLIIFIYAEMLDYFSDNSITTMAWLVIWLISFSLFTAGLLFNFNNQKDISNRLALAKHLSSPENEQITNDFLQLNDILRKDTFLKNILTAPASFQPDPIELQIHIQNQWHKINGNEAGIDIMKVEKQDDRQLIKKICETLDTLPNGIVKGRNAVGVPLTGILTGPANNIWVQYVFKDQNQLVPSENSNYQYSVYKNGTILYNTPNQQPFGFPQNWSPQKEESKEIIKNGQSELWYYHPKGNLSINVSKPYGGLIKPISLFSYLFSFLVVLIMLSLLFNRLTGIWQSSYNWIFPEKASFRNRIQLSVIILIIISFLAIGIVTVVYFSNTSKKYSSERVERILNTLQWQHDQNDKKDSFKVNRKFLDIVGQLYNASVSIYDRNGFLLLSSENSASNLLDGRALYQLKSGKYTRWSDNGIRPQVVYASLNNSSNHPSAYIKLPYTSGEHLLQSDVSDFIGALLNVYVFLLLIAVPIAITVANSITNPLAVVGDKLKQFKLGKRNEPLEWKNKDELGELIGEYNKMIEQVEESAKLLAETEREGAWRDMARQVAHEIKNPLTPMKLNIQYLIHAYKSDPDGIEPLLKKVSESLIAQIDSLSQIASDFSTFANINRAEPTLINLKDTTESAFSLFEGTTEVGLKFHNMTDGELPIFADRMHLTRVLNNLIKNAIQSISPDKKGQVDVFLYKRDNYAIVRVSDNGIGIPPELQEKVFKPYFTTKGAGTGLGLVICKNIVEAAKGKIYFETREGKGTDFYIEIPLHSEEVAEG